MKKLIITTALVLAILPLIAVYHKIGEYATPIEAQSLVVENGIVYLAEGFSNSNYAILQMLDVSDPESPCPLGSINLPLGVYDSYQGLDLEMEDGVAYIVLKHAGFPLKIVDVSDPQNPFYISNIGGGAMDICVVDSLAFVADYYYGLRIYDVSDPSSLVLLCSYDTPGSCEYVTVAGNTAYVGNLNLQGIPPQNIGGFQVIDVFNPQNPVLFGSLDGPYPRSIAVSGNLALVAGGGLYVIDTYYPGFPIVLGQFYISSGYPYSVVIADSIAYLAYESAGMIAIDFTAPQSPFQLSTYSAPGNTYDVQVIGNIAYLAGSAGLQCVEISQPQNPALVASVDSLNVHGTAFADGMAYVADGGLKIIDVSDAQHPVLLGSCDTPEVANHITVMNDIAYTSGSWFMPLWGTGNCELDLIDISNPQNPAVLDSCSFGNGEIPAGCVAVQAGTAYVAHGSSLKVFDVSDPQNTCIAGSYPVTGYIRSIAIADSIAYVSTSAGLLILDISVPLSPSLLGSYAFPADDVFLFGGLAYVAMGSSGVQILDVSDPATPVLISSIPLHHATSYIDRCLIRDNLLYTSDNNWNEISIYDISAPQSPILIDRYAWNLCSYDMWVNGNLLYTANGAYGLNIHDLSLVNADDPVQIPPSAFQMRNFPNPFNPETTISYTLPAAGPVSLGIYNSRGQLVKSLSHEEQPAGEHSLIWNGRDDSGHSVASGLYLCRIASNGKHETRKMLLMK